MRRCTSCCWPTTWRPIWPARAWAQGIGAAARSRPGPASLRTVMGLLAPGGRRVPRRGRCDRRRPRRGAVPPGAKASAVTPPSWPSSRASSRAVMTSMTRIERGVAGDRERAAVVGEREVRGVADGAEGDAGFGIPEHHGARRRRAAWRPAPSPLVTSRRPARAKATAADGRARAVRDERADLLAARLPQRQRAVLAAREHRLAVGRDGERGGVIRRVDADDAPALVEPPQREALAAALGGRLLGQRQRAVVGDGAEQQADVAGELGPLGAGREIPDAERIVLRARPRRPPWRRRRRRRRRGCRSCRRGR